MSTPDFATAENNQELAQEVNCLKALLTLMLQAMGQADAGRVIIKMEKQIAQMEDQAESAVFATPLSKLNKLTASKKNGWMHAFSRYFVCHAERFSNQINPVAAA
jgi:hypothetical protein